MEVTLVSYKSMIRIYTNRSEMINMLVSANQASNLDVETAFKSTWVINTFDGSEDFMISDRIFSMVGPSTREFRARARSKGT